MPQGGGGAPSDSQSESEQQGSEGSEGSEGQEGSEGEESSALPPEWEEEGARSARPGGCGAWVLSPQQAGCAPTVARGVPDPEESSLGASPGLPGVTTASRWWKLVSYFRQDA